MASLLSGIVRTSILISYILIFATIGEASVTWRRVAKTSTRAPESQTTAQQTAAISPSKPATKAPITWKRSTIVRRSTDVAENSAHAEELDDLNDASSEKDEETEDLDENSEVKPLVPGSRPGFWFDSARRKKPSALLRPGTRRNSLFPTRSSTTEASTTVSVTPFPIIPRTPPEVSNSAAKNVSTRLFGRNRSTKSPVTFRRRLKTTVTPKKTTKTETADLDEDIKDDVITDMQNNKEREEDIGLAEEVVNTDEDYDDIKPKRPKFNIRRRRPYNGTRLSWTKKRIIKTTTATPQQLTTISVSADLTQDYDKGLRKTTKFPRTRINSRTNSTFAPNVIRSRIKQITNINDKLKESVSANVSGKINNSKDVNKENISEYKLEKENLKEKTENMDEIYGTRQLSIDQSKSKTRTTVEPFYITKEYGMVATAVPEITRSYGSKETMPTPIPNGGEEENGAQLGKVGNLVEADSTPPRKEKKRTRTRVTGTPKITPKFEEKSQNIEKENDYNEDPEASFEYIDDFVSKYTTTENPTTTKVGEEWVEKRLVNRSSRTTTTLRPLTLPVIPTIDPNSNAYVVWSVGHGGSGWSYEKQGGNVKWSAQNSEAEGDSWSVVSKEDGNNDQNYQWTPIRNPAEGYKSRAKTEANVKGKLAHFLKDKGDTPKYGPVTYIPKLMFRNETILNFKKDGDLSIPTYQINNNSFTDLSHPSKLTYTNNATSSVNNLSKISLQETQPANFPSQTPPPFYSTIEDHFNAEVDGIVNRYAVPSNYPYIAEIRETFNPPQTLPTNTPTTRPLEFQEYITQNVDASQEKEYIPPTSVPQEGQFVQVPETNIYPAAYPGIEIKQPYTDSSKNSEHNTNNNQYPIVGVPYQSYQSSIPPELAKAVVKAKKWRVVGNGGDEGWSLHNEDGILEWKIHNVDGHWRVTGAEELAKTQSQLQSTPEDNDRPQTGSYGYNDPVAEESPKVWTLEDDYAKWRAVSIERGIPTDNSSEESFESSKEYDYDSKDLSDGYYPNDDYDNFEPVNPDAIPYRSNDVNSGRPQWDNGQNQIIQTQLQKAPFSGSIEIANSRDDAIAAWKSLIAQHGHWKISGDINERTDQYSSDKSQHIPNKNSDRRVLTVPEKHENNVRDREIFSEAITDNYGRDNHPQVLKSEYYREDDIALKNKQNTKDGFPTNFKQHDSTLRLKAHENYDYNDKHQPAKFRPFVPDTDTFVGNYDSLPESTEQKFDKYENKRNSKDYPIDPKEENYQKQKENKFYDLEAKLIEHRIKNHKQAHHKNHQRERINPEIIKDNKEDVELKGNAPKNHYKPYHSLHSLIESNAHINGRIPERNIEQIVDSDNRLKNKDHSKLESLISKLEAIQKETKGRAVLDLTALLNQMKSRRNSTSTILVDGKSNAEKQNQAVGKYYSQENSTNIENSDTNILPKNVKSENLQETKHLQNDRHYQSDEKAANQNQSNVRHNKNENVNKRHSIRYQNHDLRRSDASNRSKRRKRPNSKLQYSRTHSFPINRTASFDGISNPAAKESEHNKNILTNVSRKMENVNPKAEKEYISPTHTSQLNSGKSRSDSSSSEELYVDLRDVEKKEAVVPRRRKRPSRKRSRESHHSQPIVMKGETEIEDETGSKKSRKIIVIDYAGSQKRRKPVDKKDLELIIRNVKHRRSELKEHIAES